MVRRAALVVIVGLVAAGCSGTTDDLVDDAPAASPTSTSTSTTTASVAATTDTPSTTTEGPTTTVSASVPAPDSTPGVLAAPTQRTLWTGTIDGEIGFTMWLAQNGDHLFGELRYDTVGEPIVVVGWRRFGAGFVVLHEFAPNGRITGSLVFEDHGDRVRPIEGTWDDRTLVLEHVGLADEPYWFDPLVREGEYLYRFKPFDEGGGALCCGPVGSLHVSWVDADSMVIEFENIRGAPSFNLATIPPTEIPRVGHQAIFDGAEVGDELRSDCAFGITVYDGFAFVDHIDQRWDCGFGMGASVEGVYLLTDPERWG